MQNWNIIVVENINMEKCSDYNCPKIYREHSNLFTTQCIKCKHLLIHNNLVWGCGIPGWEYQNFAWTHDCIKFETGNICLVCKERYKCITDMARLRDIKK